MFQKAMDLDLRWHLMRKTGEVTRVMDRGTSAIQQVLSTGEPPSCHGSQPSGCIALLTLRKLPQGAFMACVSASVVRWMLYGTLVASVPASPA